MVSARALAAPAELAAPAASQSLPPAATTGLADPGWIVLILLSLAGVVSLLLLWGRRPWWGRTRAGRSRSAQRSDHAAGSARPGPDSFLPASRSILFPRSHHEALHDARYLDRILRAELEDGTGRRARSDEPRRDPGESGSDQSGSGEQRG